MLEGKRLLLFSEMCRDAGVRDEALLDHLTSGLPLVGRGADTPEFPGQSRPPALSTKQARASARWIRAAAEAKCVAPDDDELARKVWAKTEEEVSSGWLVGPFSIDDLLRRVGP